VSAGELGDARGFLDALAPEHLTLEIGWCPQRLHRRFFAACTASVRRSCTS